MPRFWSTAVLSAGLTIPVAMTPVLLRAQDHHNAERNYHDKDHNDEHQWNSHEDRAYRMYAKEKHLKYRDFSKLKAEEQQSYWGWRHEHSDAQLKIEIR